MVYAANQHETLQHRHALLCGSDVVVQAAAYDSRRHHVCLYVTARVVVGLPLGATEVRTEHSLRLFSLKRELRKVVLFGALAKSKAALRMQLWYAPSADAYVCVYAQALSGMLVLEPASLNLAFEFPGTPATVVTLGAMASDDLLLVTRITSEQAPPMTTIDIWNIARLTIAGASSLLVETRATLTSVADEVAMVSMSSARAYGILLPPTSDAAPRRRSSLIVWDRASRQILKIHNGFDDALQLVLLTLCGDWLVTLHADGSMNLWNASFTHSKLYAVGSPNPFRCMGGAPLPGASVVDIVPVPLASTNSPSELELDLFTIHSDRSVQQFRFRAEAPTSAELNVYFDLLGAFDPHVHTPVTSKTARAFGLAVQVDMGHSVEHLFLVPVQNTVHVLKVQSLAESLYVLEPRLSLSRLDMAVIDAKPVVLGWTSKDTAYLFSLAAPATATVAHVLAPIVTSACLTSISLCLSFVLIGFSNGLIQAYDQTSARYIGLFQDPQLNTPISVLLMLALPTHVAVREGDSAWGGKLRSKARLASASHTDAPTMLLAGTSDGWLYGWRTSGRSTKIQELQATWRWQAHVHHVHTLLSVCVDSRHFGVLSVAGPGHFKIWDLHAPPPSIVVQHDGSCPSKALVTSACLLTEHAKLLYLICGYEDGAVQAFEIVSQLHAIEATSASTWDVQWRLLASVQPHERRVACIRQVPHPGHLPPPLNILFNCAFATSSYDGHVIVWVIDSDARTIVERRYFELYAPVLSVFAYGDFLVVGLPTEICRVQYVCNCPDSERREQTPDTAPASVASPVIDVAPTSPSLFNSHAVIVVPSIARLPQETPPGLTPDAINIDVLSAPPIEALKDSLSMSEPPSHSPLTKIGSATQAIYDFAKALYRDVGDDPSQIHVAAGDLRRVYRTWQGLSPTPLRRISGKEVSEYLRRRHWQLETPVVWQDILDALYAFATEPTTTQERTPGPETPSSTTKALVSYNILGEKHVTYVPVSTTPLPSSSAMSRTPAMPRVNNSRPVVSPLGAAGLRTPIVLPKELAAYWHSHVCWCNRVLSWPSTPTGPETDASIEGKCTSCRHRRISLSSPGDSFTERAVIAIIYHIYHNMHMERQHAATTSLLHVTFLWFQQRYGMPSVVEHKLCWFLLSVVQFESTLAIAATFGAFLNVHDTSPVVPLHIQHLYLDGFDWLHARRLVQHGDLLPGADTVQPLELVYGGRHAHWERVSIANCQACTQALLIYPKVPPQWVTHTMTSAAETAQDGTVEIHAFLSLWIREWRVSCVAYEAAEFYLFDPTSHPSIRALDVAFRKLRVLLDCFVYCDRARDGCVESDMFISIMTGLLNLWPACDVNVLDELHRLIDRYHDHDHDGHVCYLDLFALLYVVAIKTRLYLSFPDILEFSSGYKLETDAAFEGHAVAYAQHKLFDGPPIGLHATPSSDAASSRRRLHELSTDTFDWAHTVLLDRNTDVQLNDLEMVVGTPASRAKVSTAQLHAHVPTARHAPHSVLPAPPYVPASATTKESDMASALLMRELVDRTGTPPEAVHPTPVPSTRQRRVKDVASPPPTSSTLYIQFPDTAPYRVRSAIDLELPPTPEEAPLVNYDEPQVVWRAVTAPASRKVSAVETPAIATESSTIDDAASVALSPPGDAEGDTFVTQETVAALIGAEEVVEEVPLIENETVKPHEDVVIPAETVNDAIADATEAAREPAREMTPETTSVREPGTVVAPERAVTPAAISTQEELVNDPVSIDTDVPDDGNDEDDKSTSTESNDSESEADTSEAHETLDPPATDEARLSMDEPAAPKETEDEALLRMQEELLAIEGLLPDEPIATPKKRYPMVITRVPEFSSTEILPLGKHDIAYPDYAPQYFRAPVPTTAVLRQDFEWEVTDVDKRETRDSFKPYDVLQRLSAFDAMYPWAPVAIDFTPLPTPDVSDDGDSSSDDGMDNDDDASSDDDDDATGSAYSPEASERRGNNDEVDVVRAKTPAAEIESPRENLSDLLDAEEARRRRRKLKNSSSVGDESPVVATTAHVPTPRRTFLFSHPVELKAKVLYKKRTSVSWTPEDASDEDENEDADGNRSTQREVDRSMFYGDRNVSGDICLSARLESNLQHRWSAAFETEERGIHHTLVGMAPPSPPEVVSTLHNSEMSYTPSEDRKASAQLARIRRRTKRRLSMFRSERLLREKNCADIALTLGDVWHGTVAQGSTLYFSYENQDPTSIVTFKLHCTSGNAELYASTTTPAPCSSDYDWRAKDVHAPGASDIHRTIVVYPYDKLVKRSVFHLGLLGVTGDPCYVHLSAVSSGQSLDVTESMEHVGNLIATFNSLANLVNRDLDNHRASSDDLAYTGLRAHYEAIQRRSTHAKPSIERIAQAFVGDRATSSAGAPVTVTEAESDARGFQVLLERLVDFNDDASDTYDDEDNDEHHAGRGYGDADELHREVPASIQESRRESSMALLSAQRQSAVDRDSLRPAIQKMVADRLGNVAARRAHPSSVRDPATPSPIAYSLKPSKAKHRAIDTLLGD
ncbi:hypothetical protein SDRG_03325 [Saprolegnia diclina VS20]|uniref:Uncharacterized protein n=1 Tax=Saprolegnia diclina (strain VS20) TaxID=1156394 RepID=T0S8Y7_SAPDV|nr:hypothetical protein SDRG_03325 [Saprolegnia diclina VS20]EQC39117.1 hypothetical protein SDRG_03325 [Saprolegnia diclina VS20]|eukprot:XP_008607178.1 hypothetical protein SDRG_03325 [Saprolegnia diclina VS20]